MTRTPRTRHTGVHPTWGLALLPLLAAATLTWATGTTRLDLALLIPGLVVALAPQALRHPLVTTRGLIEHLMFTAGSLYVTLRAFTSLGPVLGPPPHTVAAPALERLGPASWIARFALHLVTTTTMAWAALLNLVLVVSLAHLISRALGAHGVADWSPTPRRRTVTPHGGR